MLLIQTILPFLLLLLQTQVGSFTLRQDLEKDLGKLASTPVFISDNTSASPSVQTIVQDLQLFGVAATIDLSNSKYSQSSQGNHTIHVWTFKESDITSLYQIETTIALDTVVTQRYLENRAPTQHQIQNKFTFRTYAVSTSADPLRFYYMTEAEQGLLEYRIGNRQVLINYPAKKEGLSDILPKVEDELSAVLAALQKL
ncbi:hypothetical protein JAO76_10810 [Pontibacter sp. BT310]|uniref:DUF4468 domain-containing protein n=1 Tax=Pontibacter populi TaxID=890055 RepID=A0ABS6XEA8_9BACT|nr:MULTISPECIES: hypothetical protein [Pontibacter]MBJ6118686.1 hypothetical protein [Pontibacter sp. BT310]MBR0571115.1 hypothetical protein [Microvirga sp. STS03]MBW3365540.1 hypothetical protein [Pontibacter populi]